MQLPVKYSETHFTVRRAVREEYIRRQEGKCHYCGEPLDGSPAKKVRSTPINRRLFPPNFFKWPIHLHHDRKTDLTIGAIHNRCNAYLWQYHGE